MEFWNCGWHNDVRWANYKFVRIDEVLKQWKTYAVDLCVIIHVQQVLRIVAYPLTSEKILIIFKNRRKGFIVYSFCQCRIRLHLKPPKAYDKIGK
jgi:hypothetical protein